jgi:pyruvate formate lyase activating enzyme
MSGCHLRCAWCSNPEGQSLKPTLMFRASKCDCEPFRCVEACPLKAAQKSNVANVRLRLDRTKCETCETFACVEACYPQALSVSGRYYTVGEIIAIIKRDREFWGNRGGVTFGGGEPFAQAAFVKDVLKECRRLYIHSAVETSAHGRTEEFLDFMADVDWAFLDIKHMDAGKHKEATGVDNVMILKNIETLIRSGWRGRPMIRMCLIEGFNDSKRNLEALAGFMKSLGLGEINVLPFHRLGESKYGSLDRVYPLAATPPPSLESLDAVKRFFEAEKLTCYLGSATPF